MAHHLTPRGSGLTRPRPMVGAVLVTLALVLVATACGPPKQTHRSIGIDAAHVTRIDMGFMQWYPDDVDSPPQPDRQATVTDPALIQELVHTFTDMPVSGVGHAWDRAMGAEGAYLRFRLDDGSTVTLEQIFIAAHDVIIVWDDGSASHTDWGVRLVDYYYDDRG